MFKTLLVQPLFNLLVVIYAFLPIHDFGLAIILFTALVRLALWPLVNKQLHSQKAMQKLAPEITKIRAKAKGDRQLESKLLMELYKEKEISPFASFTPLLIQLPIFFALFVVLQDIVKPGQIAGFVYGSVGQLGPIKDIISGGAFNPSLLGLINLAKPSLLLAVLAGAAQYVQTKQLTPKHTSDDPAARMAASMGTIFPFLTAIIAMTLPSALALYWTVTSLVAIVQQKMVLQRDVEEMEGVKK